MGYEVSGRWMLSVCAVFVRRFQSDIRRPFSEREAIRQIPAGWSEYLPSTPVSIADPLQGLRCGNQQLGKVTQRNLRDVASYPDDLLRFQARRLAVS